MADPEIVIAESPKLTKIAKSAEKDSWAKDSWERELFEVSDKWKDSLKSKHLKEMIKLQKDKHLYETRAAYERVNGKLDLVQNRIDDMLESTSDTLKILRKIDG